MALNNDVWGLVGGVQEDHAPVGDFIGFPSRYFDEFGDKLSAFGIDQRYFGRTAMEVYDQLGEGAQIWRYQCMKQYAYFTRGPTGDTEIAPVQLRVVLYTVGEPSYDLKQHFREISIPRVATAFNTGPPPSYEGYLAGFQFDQADPIDEEDREVAATDVTYFGIPQFYCEVYDEDNEPRGVASGFFDPFEIRHLNGIPQHEMWEVTRNHSRGTYEIWVPNNTARFQDTHKEVYVNGHYVGNFRPKRGTFEIKRKYQTRDGTYKDSRTGMQMNSRDKLIEFGMHPNELIAGTKVYKVAETADRVDVVTAHHRTPAEFDPVDPGEIESDRTAPDESLVLSGREESTLFGIRRDENLAGALGYYSPPAVREITRLTTESDLVMI